MDNNNLIMSTHEREQKFQALKSELRKKYHAQIVNFCEYHDVEPWIGWDMLEFNAKCFMDWGVKGSVIAGGGHVDVIELVADFKKLFEYVVKQEG